jgi:hypothetical protein
VDVLQDLNNPGLSPQTGISNASINLWYNPSVLAINDVSKDIQLGTLGNPAIPGDGYSPGQNYTWGVHAVGGGNNPGQLTLSIFPTNAVFISGTLGGQLAVINFQVLANAPLGTTMIDLAADQQAGSTFTTSISDDADAVDALQLYNLDPQPNSNVANGLPIPPFTADGPTDNTGALQTMIFGGTVTGGTFTLAFAGATTAPVTYSSTASTLQNNIQNALNTLSTTGASDAVQEITFGSNFATGSTFTLAFNGATTTPISYSGSANTLETNIQQALDNLSTIGAGNTSVAPPTTSHGTTTVDVAFQNALGPH